MRERDTRAIPHGYKMTEVGVIPEDWGITALEQVVEFLDGQRRPIKSSDRAKMQGIYPYYGASGIVDYVNDYIFNEPLILLGEDGENILSRNTRLAFQVSGKIWVNNHAHVLRPLQDVADITFLTEYLESLNYADYNTGTAQPKLNKKTCSRIPVILPTLAEQRAIADALSDVDAQITALDEAIAKKRDIKQGAMQRLLTGEERLPGFSGAWEKRNLDNCVELRTNRFDPKTSKENMFCIELEHIAQGQGTVVDYTDTKNQLSHKTVFLEGDVLFGKLRPYLRKYWQADRHGVCSTEIWVFNGLDDILVNNYLFYIVQTNQFIDITNLSTGTHMPRADWKVVRDFEFIFPSPQEQEAIAAVLSDMDTEISALEAQREKTVALKQGMMQELLTGKTRLI